MNELMIAGYVKSSMALDTLKDNLAARRERGADALEYVGMLVVAAIIIGFIVAAAKNADIQNATDKLIKEILGGGRAPEAGPKG